MEPLNLPAYDFTIRTIDGRSMIYDSIRQRYVRLTPEEWVRQHFVNYLVQERGYPQALIAIESGLTYLQMARRADLVVYDRRGAPLLVTECKAPDVHVGQDVFDQVAGYNMVTKVNYLVVTNGLVHYCCKLDRERHTYEFLEELPAYDAL
jgi:hypothetical protein